MAPSCCVSCSQTGSVHLVATVVVAASLVVMVFGTLLSNMQGLDDAAIGIKWPPIEWRLSRRTAR